MKLKTAFFGAPSFAASLLKELLVDSELGIEIALVVTQPDRPVGRKQLLQATPVKETALSHAITVIDQPLSSLSPTFLAEEQIDLAILFAYGAIIPASLLAQPKYGFWNIHPSLLPAYRGASPIAYPLILGDTKTGITLMKMDEKLDHGPIIDQKEITIPEGANRADMEVLLTNESVPLLKAQLQNMKSEREYRVQDHDHATFTRMLHKNDGFIELDLLKRCLEGGRIAPESLPITFDFMKKNPAIEVSSISLFNYFKGLYPWPGIWTQIEIQNVKKRLKITKMTEKNGVSVIEKVQLEGKTEVDFSTFNSAYKIF